LEEKWKAIGELALKRGGVDEAMSYICYQIKRKLLEFYNTLFRPKFRIAFMGLEKSGKSTLVRKIFEKESNGYTRRSGVKVYEYDKDDVRYAIYDISGKRASDARYDQYYRKCNVLIFCADSAQSKREWKKSRELLHELLYRNMWLKKSILVLGTKNDVTASLNCKDIIFNLDIFSILDRDIACFSVSAKDSVNIDHMKQWISDRCMAFRERKWSSWC
jgi:ADP-ribosylation factor-like protein 8